MVVVDCNCFAFLSFWTMSQSTLCCGTHCVHPMLIMKYGCAGLFQALHGFIEYLLSLTAIICSAPESPAMEI